MRKRKNNEKGILSIEAAIVLTSTMFFVVSILGFGRIYRAQAYMTHCTYETAKNVAFSSYSSKLEENTLLTNTVIKSLLGLKEGNYSIKSMWNSGNVTGVLDYVFTNYVSDNTHLAVYEITNIDFSQSRIYTNTDQKDLIITVSYDVGLPFDILTIDKVTLSQQVRTGLWER